MTRVVEIVEIVENSWENIGVLSLRPGHTPQGVARGESRERGGSARRRRKPNYLHILQKSRDSSRLGLWRHLGYLHNPHARAPGGRRLRPRRTAPEHRSGETTPPWERS